MCHDCAGRLCRPIAVAVRIQLPPPADAAASPQSAPTGVQTGQLHDPTTILKPAVLYQRGPHARRGAG